MGGDVPPDLLRLADLPGAVARASCARPDRASLLLDFAPSTADVDGLLVPLARSTPHRCSSCTLCEAWADDVLVVPRLPIGVRYSVYAATFYLTCCSATSADRISSTFSSDERRSSQLCSVCCDRRLAARGRDVPAAAGRPRPARRARPRRSALFWAVVLSVAIVARRSSLALARAASLQLRAAAHRRSADRRRRSPWRRASTCGSAEGAAAGLAALIPLVLALLGAWRFFPPSEYIIGGKDPGRLHQRGDPDRAARRARRSAIRSSPRCRPSRATCSFPYRTRTAHRLLQRPRSWGSSSWTPTTGAVVGQFPHLFPASIAIGYGLDGLTGARRAVGVLGDPRRCSRSISRARGCSAGPPPAAAAALLALNVIQVWFARYPNAEIVMQALLFAALLANARAHVDGDPFFAPVAGALLGLLLFLRFDAVLGDRRASSRRLALGVFAGQRPRALDLLWRRSRPAAHWPRGYLLGPMRAYAQLPIVFLANLPSWQYACCARRRRRAGDCRAGDRLARAPRRSSRHASLAPSRSALVVACWPRLRLVLPPARRQARPTTTPTRCGRSPTSTSRCRRCSRRSSATRSSRAGLFWRDPALFLTARGVLAVLLLQDPDRARALLDGAPVPAGDPARRRCCSSLPRRSPACAAAARDARRSAARVGDRVPRAARRRSTSRAAQPLLAHTSSTRASSRGSRSSPDRSATTTCSSSNRGTRAPTCTCSALPLAYIYARNVLVLSTRAPDKATFAAFLDWARTQLPPRAVPRRRRHRPAVARGTRRRRSASERFQVPEYESPSNAYPRGRASRRSSTTASTRSAPPGRGRPAAVRPRRRHQRRPARPPLPRQGADARDGRSAGRGERRMISVTAIAGERTELALWMDDGGRPAAAPPADVTVLPRRPACSARSRVSGRRLPGLHPSPIPTGRWRPRAADSQRAGRSSGCAHDRPGIRTRARHARRPRPRRHGRSRGGKIARDARMAAPADLRSARARARGRRRMRCSRAGALPRAPFRRAIADRSPRRILLLRLERIGDLLMALPALADLRALAPDAEIDLVVGSWNARLARAIPASTGSRRSTPRGWRAAADGAAALRGCSRCGARAGGGAATISRSTSSPTSAATCCSRPRARGGRAGYRSGGGGALLDRRARLRPARAHHRQRAAAGRRGARTGRAAARRGRRSDDPGGERGREAARHPGAGRAGRWSAMHVSGGRAIKQWDPKRFASVARRSCAIVRRDIVLTGAPAIARWWTIVRRRCRRTAWSMSRRRPTC